MLAEPAKTSGIVLEALRRSGKRAVLLSGRGGLGDGNLSDEIFVADEIPHEWLLPRVQAFVHHASAGSTAAAIRAGVPSVAVPFYGDQTLCAALIERAGAGARLPAARLSSEKLAAALRWAIAEENAAGALTLGERVRAEDGIDRAVSTLHDYLF